MSEVLYLAQKHGHVTPREDGFKARCGGPAICQQCAYERAVLDAFLYGDGWLKVNRDGRLSHFDGQRIQIKMPA